MEDLDERSESPSSPGTVYENLCTICDKPSKYRCPKCSTFSCSLECVKVHKDESGCDGVRDKTAYVPIEEFHERHLLSDYHFLENIGRTIDNAQRSKKKFGLMHYLPHNLYRLQKAARERKIDLHILPLMFARRKASTTFLRYNDRRIFWKLEWKFPQCDFTSCDDRVDEDMLLGACLDKYLLPESIDIAGNKLMYYQSLGHKGVSVFLKKESSAANENKYVLLNQNKSLKRNFRGKKIIEFPTLLVVPNIHISCYIESSPNDEIKDID
ncbi:Box C/D snoRNA protein 1 like protein [Argiope bruennichi]|uniref:Box C/D snoRNA protein 1 n=1 Tax=Argiope bruennichi TaxID=94029 RepID=A0A8T0EXS2_ARGBR|nr:Box C/D snoRNA protein 1 like protein [Argiope bruennichi]